MVYSEYMRRFVIGFSAALMLVLPLLSPTSVLADCTSEEGTCRQGMGSCEFGETPLHGAGLCPSGHSCCVSEEGPGCKTSKGISGIDTAIGCIPVENVNDTAAFFLRWGMGIAGGLALILIIYASFLITTSAGNPKGVQAGKELLVSALTGLLFLIFGVFALRIIGVDILGIPGL